jgi:hypothetical protein
MPNLTLTGPAEKIRAARIIAAQCDTSVSALFFDYVDSIQSTHSHSYDEAMAEELALMKEGLFNSGSATWTRDELHDRLS